MNKTQEELNKLQNFAQIGKKLNNVDLEHLDAPMGAYNYIRMADTIANHIPKKSKFLDWGAGYGQITWLLKRREIDVVGYNIEERANVSQIPELADLFMIRDKNPVKLPFEDNSFDGVCSCGVLEHVTDPEGSLKEIYRVLRPGGYFYLFMLPQKTSWVEKLSEWRGISVHPVRYTVKGVIKMFKESGFTIEKLWKFNLIPKNLTGLPNKIKKGYGKLYKFLYPLDSWLSKIPFLNLLSGTIEAIAKK